MLANICIQEGSDPSTSHSPYEGICTPFDEDLTPSLKFEHVIRIYALAKSRMEHATREVESFEQVLLKHWGGFGSSFKSLAYMVQNEVLPQVRTTKKLSAIIERLTVHRSRV